MDDLFKQWAGLWTLGMGEVWRHYASAQQTLHQQGRALVGQTPADVVHVDGPLRLLRYRPLVEQPLPIPLLCIPSMINQYYVMDLTQERSLVRYLLAQGIDVYMLDWGSATEADRHLSLDEHITGRLGRCAHYIQGETGQRAVSLLGYCMGGMMAAVYAVLFPGEVANLINLAGPINYHDDGIYSIWTRPEWLDADLMVNVLGNIPAGLLNTTFHTVRPTDQLLQAINYWERRHDEAYVRRFAAMQLWLNDPTPFPGEVFRKYITDLYQQNLLAQGLFQVHGQTIDLGTITAPTLTIGARKDHIAPWESVAVLHDLITSDDKELIVLESGHIGMVVGSDARTQLWPRLGVWLTQRSDSS
ncbi:MAG: alpha/beta fold hydrolase [Chloroflexi bacterium]|nr:alpha/beta fold hydrolase [Chloroflexota bacterium]